jgi:hypothetical protein
MPSLARRQSSPSPDFIEIQDTPPTDSVSDRRPVNGATQRSTPSVKQSRAGTAAQGKAVAPIFGKRKKPDEGEASEDIKPAIPANTARPVGSRQAERGEKKPRVNAMLAAQP